MRSFPGPQFSYMHALTVLSQRSRYLECSGFGGRAAGGRILLAWSPLEFIGTVCWTGLVECVLEFTWTVRWKLLCLCAGTRQTRTTTGALTSAPGHSNPRMPAVIRASSELGGQPGDESGTAL